MGMNTDLLQWSKNTSNKELVKVLHKSVIRNFQKRKVHSSYIENIWGADLADMQLVSRFNKVIPFFIMLLIFQ